MGKAEQISNQQQTFFWNKYGEKYNEWNNLQSELAGLIKNGCGKYLETEENRKAISELLEQKILEINSKLNGADTEIQNLQLQVMQKEQELALLNSGKNMYSYTMSDDDEEEVEDNGKTTSEKQEELNGEIQKLKEKIKKLQEEDRDLYEVAIDAKIEICNDKLNRIKTPLGQEQQKKADEAIDKANAKIKEIQDKVNAKTEKQQQALQAIQTKVTNSLPYINKYQEVYKNTWDTYKGNSNVDAAQKCIEALSSTYSQCLEYNTKRVNELNKELTEVNKAISKKQAEEADAFEIKSEIEFRKTVPDLEKFAYNTVLGQAKQNNLARKQLEAEVMAECQKVVQDELGDDLLAEKSSGIDLLNIQQMAMHEMAKWPQSIIDMFNQISELLYSLMTGIKPKLPGLKQPNFDPNSIKIKMKSLMEPVFTTLKTLPVPEIPLLSPLLDALDIDPVNKDLTAEKQKLLEKLKGEIQVPTAWKDSLMFFMQTIMTCMSLFPMLLIKLIFDILDAIIGMFNEIAGALGVPSIPYPLNLVPKVIKMIPDLYDMMCNLPGNCWLILQDKFKALAANLSFNGLGNADSFSAMSTPKTKEFKIECPEYRKEALKQAMLEEQIVKQSGLTTEENKRLSELPGLIADLTTEIDRTIAQSEVEPDNKATLIKNVEKMQKKKVEYEKELAKLQEKQKNGLNSQLKEEIKKTQEEIEKDTSVSYTGLLANVGKSIASFDSASAWNTDDLEKTKAKEILDELKEEAMNIQVVKPDPINTIQDNKKTADNIMDSLGLTNGTTAVA